MSNKLSDLEPKTAVKAYAAITEMNADARLKYWGVDCVDIVETKRELSTQMAYYARGRMAIGDVKRMYKAAGLYDITDAECRVCNTWTLESKHLSGKAIDLVPIIRGKRAWNAEQKIWDRMGELGKEAGLTWGGDWNTPDLPHFENRED